ncbi:VOC family protein [Kineococcus sp. NPDC059986]|uniref:VOC family protein n=1 Tax=Kineococcus sp. NPDC059986 TaxID=3155538 RepID=UPI00344F93A4
MEFLRALPVLPVHDLDAETAFYEALSFHVQHRDDGFAALERDRVLFGLRQVPADVPVPPGGVSWQVEVDDVAAALAAARTGGLYVAATPHQQPSGEWTLRLVTPAGYELVLEGPSSGTTVLDLRALALSLPDVVELVDEGRTGFRRVGGAWLARVAGDHAELHTGDGPDGVTAVDLRTVTRDHLEELLRSAWEENPGPVPDVGPLRTE